MSLLVRIGSTNPNKVEAFRELVQQYPFLNGAIVEGIKVNSEVSDQPKGIEETMRGATNRARGAYNVPGTTYGVGLESGLIEVPHSRTGMLELTACVIWDGIPHTGLSLAFESPEEVMRLMLEEGLNMNDAYFRAGLTNSTKLGAEGGAIGLLTRGRKPRKEYTKDAIISALTSVENPQFL